MTEDSNPNRTIRQRYGAAGEPVRVSDAERDTALRTLATHFADGRLNRGEFDQRADAALAARTQPDLDTLFADLPGTAPAPADAPVAARTGRRHGAFPLPPIALLLAVLTIAAATHGFPLFPLIPALLILSRRNRRWHRAPRSWT